MFKGFILISYILVLAHCEDENCQLPLKIEAELQSYSSTVQKIIGVALTEKKGKLYNDVKNFTDFFGSRKAGSLILERSIDNVIERMKNANLEVKAEDVEVPHWVRGVEYAEILSPRGKKMNILGLGFSAPTTSKGLVGKVVVIEELEEAYQRAEEIKGAILLINGKFTTYHESLKYRNRGPCIASELGAIAALVRSITDFSIDSPHTGATNFKDQKPIPAAAVTLEDADYISRLVAAGENVTVLLYMEGKLKSNKISRNVIADLPGGDKPHSYVVLSGHIDSWDVGQGVLDDGGGAFLSWHSVALLKSLGIRPKRTIRAILWTAEELGLFGAKAYLANHKDEIQNWTVALESDNGVFEPRGLTFAGSKTGACIMSHIIAMLKPINATTLVTAKTAGSDIEVFRGEGVPLLEPLLVNNKYFWYHHTNGDGIGVMKSEDFDKSLAMFAVTAYVLGELSIQIPRDYNKTGPFNFLGKVPKMPSLKAIHTYGG